MFFAFTVYSLFKGNITRLYVKLKRVIAPFGWWFAYSDFGRYSNILLCLMVAQIGFSYNQLLQNAPCRFCNMSCAGFLPTMFNFAGLLWELLYK